MTANLKQSIDPNVFVDRLQAALSSMEIHNQAWRIRDTGTMIERHFHFADFRSGFAFMAHMALFSEHLDHHPSWTQDYKNLLITLQTHDLGGLSELDLQWAVEAERLYKGIGADVNV